jgi:hypothetical protein
MAKYADLEQEQTAVFAIEAQNVCLDADSADPHAQVSKEQFQTGIQSKKEVLHAVCNSLNSCSGMGRQVEELKKWVPTFDLHSLHQKLLPAAIARSKAKLEVSTPDPMIISISILIRHILHTTILHIWLAVYTRLLEVPKGGRR